MSFVCYNGQFFPSSQPLLTASNPGFKWGDGIFETMKYFKGRILLETFHFDRLFTSLRLLQINAGVHFNSINITSKLQELCRRNQCESSARIRLAVYRNEKNEAEWLAEAI